MAAIAAVNALTEGTTDVGTLAVTDFEVVATKEVPLYVSKTTVTVPLVLILTLTVLLQLIITE